MNPEQQKLSWEEQKARFYELRTASVARRDQIIQELWMANYGLAVEFASRARKQGGIFRDEDNCQELLYECLEAIGEAILRFDPDLGNMFSTLVWPQFKGRKTKMVRTDPWNPIKGEEEIQTEADGTDRPARTTQKVSPKTTSIFEESGAVNEDLIPTDSEDPSEFVDDLVPEEVKQGGGLEAFERIYEGKDSCLDRYVAITKSLQLRTDLSSPCHEESLGTGNEAPVHNVPISERRRRFWVWLADLTL